ncbi:response regulator transcription factor [Neobacillus rhizophilus]|uniref:Helix-turn-helix transcriptional regulator n=1 Tax=Neobacillus rhizophilus TaxID=2833579 RepID=A0A942U7P8_9BACI|nr:helix-turn-helix transcriptional regulator [Neobacillus rhizophilus]MBS4214985.1 helix-turn-helix transcriptional regulator [Neobacillus rhizophilus]
MVSFTTIQQSLQSLEPILNHEEKFFKILEIYMELFPVQDSFLLRYSPLGYLAEGMISLNPSGGIHIGEIREDIRSFPIIFSAINERKAKYCTGLEYLKQMSIKYPIPSNLNSFVVVPIFFNSVVFGYICSTEFEENAKIDDQLLLTFTFYGKEVGKEIIGRNYDKRIQFLSRRELEVMRRISLGESTKEMSESMAISELTINQYVKTAIKKLEAKNRSHAVGELFRKGIL